MLMLLCIYYFVCPNSILFALTARNLLGLLSLKVLKFSSPHKQNNFRM